MKPKTLGDKEADFLRESAGSKSLMQDITPSDVEDLRAAIAEAAYYRAEGRGFEPGFEEEDWIESEREIRSSLV